VKSLCVESRPGDSIPGQCAWGPSRHGTACQAPLGPTRSRGLPREVTPGSKCLAARPSLWTRGETYSHLSVDSGCRRVCHTVRGVWITIQCINAASHESEPTPAPFHTVRTRSRTVPSRAHSRDLPGDIFPAGRHISRLRPPSALCRAPLPVSTVCAAFRSLYRPARAGRCTVHPAAAEGQPRRCPSPVTRTCLLVRAAKASDSDLPTSMRCKGE
jgi:hypothetical protein